MPTNPNNQTTFRLNLTPSQQSDLYVAAAAAGQTVPVYVAALIIAALGV